MRVEILTTDVEFAAVGDDWNELARSSPTPSVFLRHQWFADAAASTFVDALSRRRDWDVLELDYLAFDGLIATRLRPQLLERSIRCVLNDRGSNPYIPLSGTWADYWATRSRS